MWIRHTIRVLSLGSLYVRHYRRLSLHFYAWSESKKNSAYKIYAFQNKKNTLPRLCKLFHLKLKCTYFTDEVREEVPLFKKSHIFSTILNIPHTRYQFTFFVCLKMLLTTVFKKNKSFLLIGLFVFSKHLHKTNTIGSLIIEIQLYACNLDTKFALLYTLYHQRHVFAIFSDY